MSDIFLSRPDIDDQLVPVAQSIQFGQSIEIGIMLQLLRDMGAPTESDDGQAMAWMGMPTDDEHMPGLATDEQLAELRAAKGSEANDLFIDLMVAHHQAGIDMANYAAEHGKNDDVRTYAVGLGGQPDRGDRRARGAAFVAAASRTLHVDGGSSPPNRPETAVPARRRRRCRRRVAACPRRAGCWRAHRAPIARRHPTRRSPAAGAGHHAADGHHRSDGHRARRHRAGHHRAGRAPAASGPAIGDVVDVGDAKPARDYDCVPRRRARRHPELLDDRVPGTVRRCLPTAVGRHLRRLPGAHEQDPGVRRLRVATTYQEVSDYGAFYCDQGDFMAYDDGAQGVLAQLADDLRPVGGGRRAGPRVRPRHPGPHRRPRPRRPDRLHRAAGRLLLRGVVGARLARRGADGVRSPTRTCARR